MFLVRELSCSEVTNYTFFKRVGLASRESFSLPSSFALCCCGSHIVEMCFLVSVAGNTPLAQSPKAEGLDLIFCTSGVMETSMSPVLGFTWGPWGRSYVARQARDKNATMKIFARMIFGLVFCKWEHLISLFQQCWFVLRSTPAEEQMSELEFCEWPVTVVFWGCVI